MPIFRPKPTYTVSNQPFGLPSPSYSTRQRRKHTGEVSQRLGGQTETWSARTRERSQHSSAILALLSLHRIHLISIFWLHGGRVGISLKWSSKIFLFLFLPAMLSTHYRHASSLHTFQGSPANHRMRSVSVNKVSQGRAVFCAYSFAVVVAAHVIYLQSNFFQQLSKQSWNVTGADVLRGQIHTTCWEKVFRKHRATWKEVYITKLWLLH